MILEITQEDCDKGKKGDGNSCPVARCLARQLDIPMQYLFADSYRISIFDDYNMLEDGWQADRITRRFRVPNKLAQMIIDYDSCQPFEPGRYAIYKEKVS